MILRVQRRLRIAFFAAAGLLWLLCLWYLNDVRRDSFVFCSSTSASTGTCQHGAGKGVTGSGSSSKGVALGANATAKSTSSSSSSSSRQDDDSQEALLLAPQADSMAKNEARIAKVTVANNALDSPLIDRALRTHQVQNRLHGYPHYIASHDLVGNTIERDPQRRPKGTWSKPAYLLSILVGELQKPEEERLKWLFWFDADTIVLNPLTPLDLFVPPPSCGQCASVHLLISSNWDGLNSGAFALRVHPWSVSFMSAVLAYPIYRADRLATDAFRDQSAFQWLLQSPESPLAQTTNLQGREHWAVIPMRWFNSLPFNNAFDSHGDWVFNHPMNGSFFDNGTAEVRADGHDPTHLQPWKVMQGDMIVHLAGASAGGVRDSWMTGWLDRAEKGEPEWRNATTQERLRLEGKVYWDVASEKLAAARQSVQVAVAMKEAEENGKATVASMAAAPTTTAGATETKTKTAAAAAGAPLGETSLKDKPAATATAMAMAMAAEVPFRQHSSGEPAEKAGKKGDFNNRPATAATLQAGTKAATTTTSAVLGARTTLTESLGFIFAATTVSAAQPTTTTARAGAGVRVAEAAEGKAFYDT